MTRMPDHALVAYLAGPMRGVPWWGFPSFHTAAQALRARGWTIFSPAEHDESMGLRPVEDGTVAFSVSKCLEWDFARIAEASCVIVLPGWEKSTGVHWEMSVAYALDKPIYSYPDLEKIDPPLVVKDPVSAVGNCVESVAREVGSALKPPKTDEFAGCDIPEGWPERAWYEAYAGKELLVEPRQEEVVAEEVRVVDPATGGAKGQKDCRMGALDPIALEQMGLVAGMGEQKYDRFNFLKGYKWSLSIDALFRHLLAFLQGEDFDEESGLPHMAHASWHAHALTGFLMRAIGTDDRAPVMVVPATSEPVPCEWEVGPCDRIATHRVPCIKGPHNGDYWVCEDHIKGYVGVTLIGGEDTDA